MGTAVPYESAGRVRQKERTRAALVAAARDLLGTGVTPTVEQAADRARISRTTAYRYFPNQNALVFACYPALDATSLLGDDPPADPAARLAIVLRHIGGQLLEHEVSLRAALRQSLAVPPPAEGVFLRRGRALRWIEDALAPLRARHGRTAVRRLALAIRATSGIEAFAWLVDVGGLSRRAALDLMHASARTLLDGLTRQAGGANLRKT
jgi:AcrR family transcriptional regulator